MEKIEPNTGEKICIGTAQFGMSYGIANRDGQPGLDKIKRIVGLASENDIWYYDTAQSYGNSEELLGNAFAELPNRENIQCLTKLPPDFKFSSPMTLEKNILKSLKKLHLDSLWGLLLHRVKIKGDWDMFVKAINLIKRRGLIKNLGVSIYEPEDAIKCVNDQNIDVLQVPFNILDRRLIDNDFFSLAEANGKKVFIRSVYLKGLILMTDDQIDSKQMGWAKQLILDLREFVKKNNIDIKSFALKMVLQYTQRAVVIIGIETEKQLLDNIQIMNSQPIPNNLTKEWWNNLPLYPKRLLNPSLW